MFAQKDDYIVTKRLFNYKDGIPENSIKLIDEDRKGYLWFISKNNVCRFNGKKIDVLNSKVNGLQNKLIAAIYFDGYDGMIVGYKSDNEPDVELFKHADVIDINSLKVKTFNEYYINCPFKANELDLIYKVPSNECRFYLNNFSWDKPNQLLNPNVWRLKPNGVFEKLSIKAIKTVKFKSTPTGEEALVENVNSTTDPLKQSVILYNDSFVYANRDYFPYVIFSDSSGVIIEHVDLFNKKHFYHFTYDGKISHLGETFANYKNYIFNASNSYKIWYKSFIGNAIKTNGDVTLFDPNDGEYTIIDSLDTPDLRSLKPNVFYKGSKNMIWIGSTSGLIKVGVNKNKFKNFYSLKNNSTSNKNNSVRQFFIDKQYKVYSLYEFSVVEYDNKEYLFKNPWNYSAICFNNELILASGYLHQFNKRTKEFELLRRSISGEIWCMRQLNENKLLLGCTKNIDIYNANTKTIEHVVTNGFDAPALVYRFFEKGNEVIAVANNGIYVLSKDGKIIDCYSQQSKDEKKRLPFTNINDLHIDKQNVYWFATINNGLFKWDRKTNSFENFGSESGFLSSNLCRIEEDENDNLWIGTNFGLTCFDKKTAKAKVYTVQDGVVNNEFNRASSCKDDKGILYFGTVDGFTKFNPNDFVGITSKDDFILNLNVFQVYNASTNSLENLDINNKIELTDGKKNLNISVLLMDFEEVNHLYSYEIIGLSGEKKYFHDETLSITDLPYGDFVILISAQCQDGTWNGQQIKIPISVVKPIYKRVWFVLVCLLGLIVLIYLYIKNRLAKIKKQNDNLEKTVMERTAELKQSLVEQTALLQEVHHRVKNNLHFIGAMLQMQIVSAKDEKNQVVLKETWRRINSMSLVHEMLYDKDKLSFIESDSYLEELIFKLNDVVYDKQNNIHFETEIERHNFNINDCVALGMITSEIISNSVKYAFNSKLNPVITVSLKMVNGKFILIIGDNGIGLNTDKKKGGLGLRLIDIFARQLDANYTTKNEKGLTYTFMFSKNQNGK